jgi:hypothetical protein
MKTDQIVAEDEQKELSDDLNKAKELEEKLREDIRACNEQMGVPKSQVDELRKVLHVKEKHLQST